MGIISLIVILASFFLGIFVFFKPGSAIELQRRFYEKINWKMEPISMPREIRNTKIMGLLLIGFTMCMAVLYIFTD